MNFEFLDDLESMQSRGGHHHVTVEDTEVQRGAVTLAKITQHCWQSQVQTQVYLLLGQAHSALGSHLGSHLGSQVCSVCMGSCV